MSGMPPAITVKDALQLAGIRAYQYVRQYC